MWVKFKDFEKIIKDACGYNPKRVSQFRPISLCNIVYNLASKRIANRIKLALPSLISESQSAFVPGRLITDNVLITYETHHFMKSRPSSSKPLMSTNLDMSKAFDRVEWSFLLRILSTMNFPSRIVQLIHRCISRVSFSFMLNGKYFGNLIRSEALDREAPLVPIIRILVSILLMVHQVPDQIRLWSLKLPSRRL